MPCPEQPSYEELAARNAELLAMVAEQSALIASLRAEVAALRRQAGRDSSDSSQPPGREGPAAGAKTARRAAQRGRPQGGQKGHPGASLAWAAQPDETRVIEPGTCGGCGADLAGAGGRIAAAVQVFDIPPAALTVTGYQMMRRECGCGQVTTAPAPPGVTGGPVCYGPDVVAAATLLASTRRRPVGPARRAAARRRPRQPEAWRDTGELPATAEDPPPGDHPGLVKVSVPGARRLLRLAATPVRRLLTLTGLTGVFSVDARPEPT